MLLAPKQGKKDICSLPPVCATLSKPANNKVKSNSAPAQYQQRSPDDMKQIANKGKTRQASTQSIKQFKTKPIQNISFNQPGKKYSFRVINTWILKRAKHRAGKKSSPIKQQNLLARYGGG